MKEWQRGIELDQLLELERHYEHYNSFASSPFAQYKKNTIAKDIAEGTLTGFGNPIACLYKKQYTKVRTPIHMYQKVVLGYKEKGDITYSHFSNVPDSPAFIDRNKDVWIQVWAEDEAMMHWVQNLPYHMYPKTVGSKITTFGEIIKIFYISKQGAFAERRFPVVPEEEFLTCRRLGYVRYDIIGSIAGKLGLLGLSFTNHYSNYNAGKAWSALSLRGYSADPSFITKPEEMNDKWKAQNSNKEFSLQDTSLYANFPEVRTMLNELFDGEIHRVRFMKLTPGGGELKRHTDQVDPDCGNQLGQLVRIHFPIITNDKVDFSTWGVGAMKITNRMKIGEFWMLDTRKPHTVINNGDSDRIHLVVDVMVTPKVLDLMKGNYIVEYGI